MSTELERLSAALSGRYRVARELGRGGTSTVYLARELSHDRDVALKVIRGDVAGPVGLERFRREIRIASGLQHPNILPLLDSGEVDGRPYFVTPYVAGASLREVLERTPILPLEEVARIVSEVADGLRHAHESGIVHRDVKPGNILVSDGHAVLTDFGLALAADAAERLTRSGEAAGGTVHYMSPEQLRGSLEADGRSDVYSLACVAFEMLTGEPPFSGRTPWAVMARQASAPPPSASTLRPDVSRAADQVLARALEHDPGRRHPDPRAFADALADALTGGGPAAGARRPGRRRTALFGALAVMAAAASLLLLRPATGSDLDAHSVVVFPLVDSRPGAEGTEDGEETAILVGAALDHAAPLRSIDGWDWLDPELRSGMEGWTIRTGSAIARDRGARYVIDGRILDGGDSVTVLLRLHDAEDGRLLRRSLAADARGEAGTAELGRRAVVDLLPDLLGTSRPVPADALTDFHPAAVAAWLQGERAFRSSRFAEALERFQRAVGVDSTMALAAMRGAQAAGWMLQPAVVEQLLVSALRHPEALPPKHRRLAEGLQSYYAGRADEALARFDRALALDPGWSDAHMALGEVHYHLLPRGGGGLAAAEAAFREALRHDPAFTPALVHLAELGLARADTVEAVRWAERVGSAGGEGVAAAAHLGLMRRCLARGADAVAWSVEARERPLTALEAAIRAGMGARGSTCAVSAYRALAASGPPAYAWSALLGLQSHLLALARPDEARAAVESAAEFQRQRPYLLIADALGGAPFEAEADAALRELEAQEDAAPPGDAREPSATRLWALASWNGHRRRPDGTRRALEAARVLADRRGADAADSLLVAVAAAWDALAAGDSTAALTRFEALEPVATASLLAWDVWQSLGAERLAAARLHLDRGDHASALRSAATLDHPQPAIFRAYLPESLSIRARAAAALGRSEDARTYRARLDALASSSPSSPLPR